MKKNKNVDYLRVVAILIIIVYHCYTLCENPWKKYYILDRIINFGGEIGVTLFFLLSGFGLFWSLDYKKNSGEFPSWGSFIKQRCVRIMPQYYACLTICIIFMSSGLIGGQGWKHILAYLTFTQNLFVETHGSINGALWAMGTIVQFYLIAIWVYKAILKNWKVTTIISIGITIASKFVIYNYLIQEPGPAYFVYGRQVISALDNFVLGMIAAYLAKREKGKCKNIIGIICALIFCTIAICICAVWFMDSGIYQKNYIGYAGHSLVACLLAGIILGVALLPEIPIWIDKCVSFLAKNQYGMYLWHMPIVMLLHNNSPFFISLLKESFLLFTIGILVIVILIGYFSTRWITIEK